MSQPAIDPPEERAATSRDHRGGWRSDVTLRGGRLQVLDTGADLEIDRTLIVDAFIWLGFHLVVRARGWLMRLTRPRAPRIWFTPHRPRPWYLIWSAMAWAGVREARRPEDADVAFAFEDATWSPAPPPAGLPHLNFGCPDISKSHVAAVFERVFGYPLAIDPTQWQGPAVDKSERNGRHDGRLVDCPAIPQAGRHYQRLVDTADGPFTYDLRTPCIGGAPVVVMIKRKSAVSRFSIRNLQVTLHRPVEVFSADELESIGRFLSEMGCDWAGLDILRDRPSGRIYIVDVNKTDVGPIISLSLADKLRSTALMAKALRDLLPR